MKKKIEEIIVVEGRDDVSAVKSAVDAEVIEVNGFAVRKKSTLDKIKFAHEKKGVIVLCDPDFAGEKIRKTIEDYVPGVKHAYISRKEGTKKDNIGVENANADAIIAALNGAKFKEKNNENTFTMADMWDNGLVGNNKSQEIRSIVGKELRIGYANGKQFLYKLNNFGITREELKKALELVNK